MSTDEILTASQVASLLQMHPRTIYKLVKSGVIPAKKFEGGWRFSKQDILQMISPVTPAARLQSEDLEGR